MKTITHPLFIVLAVIYVVYYGLKQTDFEFPVLVSNYLADLLSIFLVNTFTLWTIRKVKNKPNLELRPVLILVSILMFTLFFEFILPQQNPIYVYDPWDILCYFISGMAYFIWRKTGVIKHQ